MGVKLNNQPLMLIDSKRRNWRARDFPSYLLSTSTTIVWYDMGAISTMPTILITTISKSYVQKRVYGKHNDRSYNLIRYCVQVYTLTVRELLYQKPNKAQ